MVERSEAEVVVLDDEDEVEGPDDVRLTVLATTDLHGQITSRSTAFGTAGGLTALAATIRDLRGEGRNVLLFDNGDLLQGSALADCLARHWTDAEGPHPLIAVMAELGLDAATLGNHDLDYGLDYALRAYASAGVPLVCANLERRDPAGGWSPILPPWRILERPVTTRGGAEVTLRIGIIGALPEETAEWNRAALGPGIRSIPIREGVESVLPSLLAQHPDLVVALCHAGLEGARPPEAHRHGVGALSGLAGIDLVIGGHTHEVFPADGCPEHPVVGAVNGMPTLLPGAHGERLGIAEFSIASPRGRRRARPRVAQLARVVPAAITPAPGRALARLESLTEEVAHAGGRTITYLRAPLSTHFALVGHDPCGRLLADALRDHARTSLEGTELAHLPVLAVTSPARSGGWGGATNFIELEAGKMPESAIFDLFPYPNPPALLKIAAAGLRTWLERAAEVFAQVEPGRPPVPLLQDSTPSYLLDTLWGVTYTIDPTRPCGARIGALELDGAPLDPDATLLLATNGHRATGAGGFVAASGAELIGLAREPLQEVLRRYLAGQVEVEPDPRPAWRLGGCGWRASLLTSPRAMERLQEVAGLRLADAGPDPSGLRRLVISPLE